MIKSTIGHQTNQSSIITHHNKIFKKWLFDSHIYHWEHISSEDCKAHQAHSNTPTWSYRPLQHDLPHPHLLETISRAKPIPKQTKTKKSQNLHTEKKDKISFSFFTFFPEEVTSWTCLPTEPRTSAGTQAKSLSSAQTFEPLRTLIFGSCVRMSVVKVNETLEFSQNKRGGFWNWNLKTLK